MAVGVQPHRGVGSLLPPLPDGVRLPLEISFKKFGNLENFQTAKIQG